MDEEVRLDLALIAFYGKDRASDDRTIAPMREAVMQSVRSHRVYFANADDVEDIAQDVWFKVIERRDTFDYRGWRQWRKYISQISLRLWQDWWRDRKRFSGHEPEGTTGVVLTHGRDVVDRAAGDLWFSYDHNLSQLERNRQVFAAQLSILEGLSWEQAAPLINPPIDRETFDKWRNDPAAIRDMAYRELYFSGSRLFKGLLSLENEPNLGQLFMEARDKPPKGVGIPPWKWAEVVAIIWRYGFGYSKQHINQRLDNKLNDEDLRTLFDRCSDLLPFYKCMLNLQEHLGPRSNEILLHRGIWFRLAFEYWYRDELELEDVFERMSPQAKLADFHLTLGMLNVWLCGKRLLRQLAKRLREMGMDDE